VSPIPSECNGSFVPPGTAPIPFLFGTLSVAAFWKQDWALQFAVLLDLVTLSNIMATTQNLNVLGVFG
jgi:hypothetical protein